MYAEPHLIFRAASLDQQPRNYLQIVHINYQTMSRSWMQKEYEKPAVYADQFSVSWAL